MNTTFTNIQARISGGIAELSIDQYNSTENLISLILIQELGHHFTELENDESVKAIVIHSQKSNFSTGYDFKFLNSNSKNQNEDPSSFSRQAHQVLNRIENSKKPVIAALNGKAYGAGLEIALACHYRLGADSKLSNFAFKDLNYGLIPSLGATQRLPELIGLRNSLSLLLEGIEISAQQALNWGLIDRLINPYCLVETAKELALAMVGKKVVRQSKVGQADRLLNSNSLTRKVVLNQAYDSILEKTRGNYPAPFKLLNCLELGLKHGRVAGFNAEIRHFEELVQHPVSLQLQQFNWLIDEFKNREVKNNKIIQTLAVIGAGHMGAAIAEMAATNKLNVFIKDIQDDAIAKAKRKLWKSLTKKVDNKELLLMEREQLMNKLIAQKDYRHFRQLDLVVEAAPENLSLKQRILAECEASCPSSSIFASNTLTLPLSEIATLASRPEQVIGMHFFSSAYNSDSTLLEIIASEKTADWVLDSAIKFGIDQGKVAIVVKDSPGFYTSRILAAFLNEALLMLEEGGDPFHIDEHARDLGFKEGPFSMLDNMGFDVALQLFNPAIINLFQKREGFQSSTIIQTLFDASFLGRKNNKGFFQYKKGGKKKTETVNPELFKILELKENNQKQKGKTIRSRLILSLTNEAVRCLEEGVIADPKDGDLGAVLGLGFPKFTGGPFRYLDSIGARLAISRLETLIKNHGQRFKAANLLSIKAESGQRFY